VYARADLGFALRAGEHNRPIFHHQHFDLAFGFPPKASLALMSVGRKSIAPPRPKMAEYATLFRHTSLRCSIRMEQSV
jgi:hypothetical protein